MSASLPRITVVIPFDGSKIRHLKATLDSLDNQTYAHFSVWVLYAEGIDLSAFFGFDCQFWQQKSKNLWQSINELLTYVSDDQVMMLQPGDVITADFISAATLFAETPVVYGDESRIGEFNRISYVNARPDFDWLLLQQLEYFRTGVVWSRAALNELGGFRWDTESPTHDLALRALEKFGEAGFHHIPNIFYRRRRYVKEVVTDFRNAAHMSFFDPRAITRHLNRQGMSSAEVINLNGTPQTRWADRRREQVEVIIYHTQASALLRLYESVQGSAFNHNVVVTLLAPQSQQKELGDVLGGVSGVLLMAANNQAGALAALAERTIRTGAEFLCWLDRPASLDDPRWLDELWNVATRPGVGMVSPRITSSVDTLEYLGVQADEFSPLHALYYHKNGRGRGRFNRGMVPHQVTWPAPSCVMFRARQTYDAFDPQFLSLAFHDLTVHLRQQSLAIAVAPGSVVRMDETPAYEDYADELPLLYAKHGTLPDWTQVPSFPWP